jgi:hypothetical protein
MRAFDDQVLLLLLLTLCEAQAVLHCVDGHDKGWERRAEPCLHLLLPCRRRIAGGGSSMRDHELPSHDGNPTLHQLLPEARR